MMMFYFPVELKTSVFGESFGSALNHSSFSTEATLKIGPKSEEMSYPDLVRRWQRMTNYSVQAQCKCTGKWVDALVYF